MAHRGETYGRYCLPVQQDPPITRHPAYHYVVGAYFVALAAFAASNRFLSPHAPARFMIDVVYIALVVGMLIAIAWIRRELRKRPHDEPQAGAGAR